jgi:hypothetical protein
MHLRRRVETLLLCALAALTTAMGNACMVKPQAAAAKKTEADVDEFDYVPEWTHFIRRGVGDDGSAASSARETVLFPAVQADSDAAPDGSWRLRFDETPSCARTADVVDVVEGLLRAGADAALEQLIAYEEWLQNQEWRYYRTLEERDACWQGSQLWDILDTRCVWLVCRMARKFGRLHDSEIGKGEDWDWWHTKQAPEDLYRLFCRGRALLRPDDDEPLIGRIVPARSVEDNVASGPEAFPTLVEALPPTEDVLAPRGTNPYPFASIDAVLKCTDMVLYAGPAPPRRRGRAAERRGRRRRGNAAAARGTRRSRRTRRAAALRAVFAGL